MKEVNLLDQTSTADSSPLNVVRVGDSETAMILFTSSGGQEDVHYNEEEEIKGYSVCNGSNCVLCRMGRKRETRIVVPVYLPLARSIGLLSMSNNFRPGSLRGSITQLINTGHPTVAFVRKEGMKFIVSSRPVRADEDKGETVIKEFLSHLASGAVSMSSAFPTVPNEQLLMVPDISKALALKEGISDASNLR